MIIRENINFERGSDPKSVMDLGVISKIKKILNDFNYRTEYVRYSGIIDGTPYQSNLPNEGSDDVWIYIHYQNNGNKEQFEKDTEWAEKFIDYRSFIRGTHERWPTGYARINTEYKELFLNAQKNLRESLDFERGQDPKKSLRIGTYHLIPQIIEKFEESEFELSQRGEVLDLILNYELSPDHFHNPAGYPKYDWEFVYLSRDFEVAILYMIDLRNSEILRKMEVSNPGIDVEYIDKQNWKITSMSPDKIYEEINQDYALIDIADAAEYLWNAYQKQTEEESLDNEEILESVNFERGMDPKHAMELGSKEALIKKICQLPVGFIDRSDHPDTSKFWNYNHSDGREWNPHKISDFVSLETLIDVYYEITKGNPELREGLDFERGIDPKQSMGIGLQKQIIKGLWGLTQERGTGSINIMQNRDSVWLKVDDYNADADTFIKNVHKNFGEEFFSDIEQRNILKRGGSWRCTFYLIVKPKYWKAFKGAFTSEGFIKESINFERGMDPKTSMKIGGIRPIDQLKKDYDRIVELIQTQKYLDFQVPFTGEADDLIEVNIHFGWGNIHNNFKNMNREELYPFEILVQKYTKLLGI